MCFYAFIPLHTIFQVDPDIVGTSILFPDFSVSRHKFHVIQPSILGSFFTTADIIMPTFSYSVDDSPGDWGNGATWGQADEPVSSCKKLSKRQKKTRRIQRRKQFEKTGTGPFFHPVFIMFIRLGGLSNPELPNATLVNEFDINVVLYVCLFFRYLLFSFLTPCILRKMLNKSENCFQMDPEVGSNLEKPRSILRQHKSKFNGSHLTTSKGASHQTFSKICQQSAEKRHGSTTSATETTGKMPKLTTRISFFR